jgi:hypothetical protein
MGAQDDLLPWQLRRRYPAEGCCVTRRDRPAETVVTGMNGVLRLRLFCNFRIEPILEGLHDPAR